MDFTAIVGRGPLFFDQIPCHGHGIELQMIVERRDTAAVVGAQHIEQGQEMIGSGNGIAGIFLFVLCSYRKSHDSPVIRLGHGLTMEL